MNALNSNLHTEETNQLLNDCIDHWGAVAQVDMFVEELGEAVVATQKLFKRDFSYKRFADLASEMADILIMAEEIRIILSRHRPADAFGEPSFDELVSQQIAFKLERTKQRLADSVAAAMKEEHF